MNKGVVLHRTPAPQNGSKYETTQLATVKDMK
jgi:hypothetical protein